MVSKPQFSVASMIRTTAAVLLTLSLVALPVVSDEGFPDPPAPPDATTPPVSAPPPVGPNDSSGPTESSWTGCVSPENGFQPVTIGDPTTICLVLSNNGDWSTGLDYMRLNFQPTADVYSRFHIPESFQQLVGSPDDDLAKLFEANITVHSESQTALSFQKLYYDSVNERIYPYLTAIITVDKGNVTGITWDNACVFCAAEECQDNTYGFEGALATEEEAQQPVGACSIPLEECKTAEQAECDLLLYVVWSGTDSNGDDFMSSSNRFSAFPKQSWSDRLSLGLPDWMNNLNPFGNDNSEENTDAN